MGNQRTAGDDFVPALLEVVKKCLAQYCGFHSRVLIALSESRIIGRAARISGNITVMALCDTNTQGRYSSTRCGG